MSVTWKWLAAIPLLPMGFAAVVAPPWLAWVLLRSGRPASVAMGVFTVALMALLGGLAIRKAVR